MPNIFAQYGATSPHADVRNSCRAATAAALPAYTRSGNVITADANGALPAIDGITLVAGDRMLLKNGAAAADNGLYDVTQVGDGGTPYILTRSVDADSSAKVTGGMHVPVVEGTLNGGILWRLETADAITLNTTGLTFAHAASALGRTFQGTVQTADATVTTVATFAPVDGTVVMIHARVAGRKTDGTEGAGYEIAGTFRRAGGATTQIGATAVEAAAEDDAAWDCTFDTSGADVRVRVTGKAATTIDWRARGLVTEAP